MSLNKQKQQYETSDQQKTHSKTNYEDCFVYNKSLITGKGISLNLYLKIVRKTSHKIEIYIYSQTLKTEIPIIIIIL